MSGTSADTVRSTLASFEALLAADGGHVALEEWDPEEGMLRIAYQKGENPRCAECVLSAEALESLVLDSLRSRGLTVERVVVSTGAGEGG